MVVGNWNMHKTPTETRKFLAGIRDGLPKSRRCDVVFCVPPVCIPAAVKAVRESRVAIGGEHCSPHPSGPWPGEVSAPMLADAGCRYVLVGHVARRAMGETDAEANAMLRAILDAGMSAILCCGETPAQREQGVTEASVTVQLCAALQGVPSDALRRIVVAYAPLWTAENESAAAPAQAQEGCAAARAVLRRLYGARLARSVVVLCGGMDEHNARQLLEQPDIDGGLIESASLEAERFLQIVEAANQSQ